MRNDNRVFVVALIVAATIMLSSVAAISIPTATNITPNSDNFLNMFAATDGRWIAYWNNTYFGTDYRMTIYDTANSSAWEVYQQSSIRLRSPSVAGGHVGWEELISVGGQGSRYRVDIYTLSNSTVWTLPKPPSASNNYELGEPYIYGQKVAITCHDFASGGLGTGIWVFDIPTQTYTKISSDYPTTTTYRTISMYEGYVLWTYQGRFFEYNMATSTLTEPFLAQSPDYDGFAIQRYGDRYLIIEANNTAPIVKMQVRIGQVGGNSTIVFTSNPTQNTITESWSIDNEYAYFSQFQFNTPYWSNIDIISLDTLTIDIVPPADTYLNYRGDMMGRLVVFTRQMPTPGDYDIFMVELPPPSTTSQGGATPPADNGEFNWGDYIIYIIVGVIVLFVVIFWAFIIDRRNKKQIATPTTENDNELSDRVGHGGRRG